MYVAQHNLPRRLSIIMLAWAVFASTSPAYSVQVSVVNATDVQCTRCREGDYLISNGKLDVIVGTSHREDESFYKFPTADALASIISIKPADTNANGDIMAGTPYVRVGNTTRHVRYDDIEVLRDEELVSVVATGQYDDNNGALAKFVARMRFESDADHVNLSLTVTNNGQKPLDNFIYALYFDPHQIYDFSPADVNAYRHIRFRAYPREGQIIAWSDRTERHEDRDYNNSGWDGGLILPDPVGVDLAPGSSDIRQYSLFAGIDHRQVLRNVFRDNGVETEPVTFEFDTHSSDYFEIVVRDAKTSALFFRNFQDQAEPLTIELPIGTYTAQTNFFPGIAQCTFAVTKQKRGYCHFREPLQGQVNIRIVDAAGERVAGKISFTGLPPTLSPYFRPENPNRHDGYWESYKNSVFPLNEGELVTLPVGSYLVSATKGPEFSIDQRTVQITENHTKSLVFQLERVIDRPDLVSIDTHLHTLESDGAVTVENKILALVASGIDVAVATDHNFPVDYRPALRNLGLQDQLTVVSGAEVTVPERLDYNTYPMIVQPDEYNHGAIDVLSPDISSLFELSRARDPDVVVQVNHPHAWQFDYFTWFGLDPDSAAFAYEGFDTSFDVLEVVNGAIYDTPDNQATRRDWFNLLRRGYFFPLVGTSDSHEIDQDEPGFSRTYVYSDDSNGVTSVKQLMQQLRNGHSFASNGPFIALTVLDRYRPGDTATITSGSIPIKIDVWTAPWIDATNVKIYVNGEHRTVAAQSIAHPSALHLQAALELTLNQDAFLVAEVTGDSDLFPMVQPRMTIDGEKTVVRPYALTNPVFIDVDGNGKFDPPLPHMIELRQRNAEIKTIQ
jgi:hypothetical protein